MAKHDRRTTRRQAPTSRSVSIQVPLPVLAVLGDIRQAFHGLCISTGMQVLQAMQEADRDGRGRRRPARRPGGARAANRPDHAVPGRRRAGVAAGHPRPLRGARRRATLPGPLCRHPDYADVGADAPVMGGVCTETIGIILTS